MAGNLLTPKTKKKNDNFLLSFNTFAQTHGVNTKDEEEEERKRQEQEQQRQTYTQRQQQIKRGNAIDQILGAEQERKRKNTMASAYKPMEYTQQQKDYMDLSWMINHGYSDPYKNQNSFVRQMNLERNYGLYTGKDLNRKNRSQLEQERGIREERYNTELGKQEAWQNRTEEDKQKALEEEQQANERVARLNALTEYGIQYREDYNGDPYLVGRDEWGLGSNQYLKTRPQDYGWDTSEDVMYDRMLYDSIYGQGEYDKRKEQRQTIEDYDAFDEEISGLWDKLESGSWDDLMQAQQERNEKAQENAGVFKTEQYKNELQDVDDALARWDRAEELEKNRPEAGGEYDPEKVVWSILGNKTDQIYYYANKDLTQEGVSDFQRYGMNRPEQYMTEDQLKTFNAYYTSGDKESAQAYYEALEPFLREMQNYAKSSLETEMSQNGYAPLMIGTRIATKPVEGVVGTANTLMAMLGNKEAMNPNSELWDLTRMNRNIQAARADAWGKQFANWFGGGDEGFAAKAGELLNGVVYSMADNMVAMGLGAGTGAAGKLAEGAVQFIMSSEATANTMYEKLESGMNPTEAAMYAFGDGVIEWFTEKVSVEQLLRPDVKEMLSRNKSEFIKYMAKNFFAEGSEEVASDVLSSLYDELLSEINGHESEREAAIKQIMAEENCTEDEAFRKWMGQYALQLGQSFAAGGLSGLIMSGGRGAEARIQNYNANKKAGKAIGLNGVNENASRGEKLGAEGKNRFMLFEQANSMEEGTQSKALAAEIQEDISKGKQISDAQVGELARTIVSETDEQMGEITENVLQQNIRSELMDAGEQNADELSGIVKKLVLHQNLTKDEVRLYAASQKAQDINMSYQMSERLGMPTTKEVATTNRSIQEKTSFLQGVQDTVTTMLTSEQNRKAAEAQYRALTQNAEAASEQEIREAEGEVTGEGLEVIADGKIGKVAGIRVATVKGEGRRVMLAMQDGTEIDISQAKAVNKGTAQALQFAAADQGKTAGNNMIQAIATMAQNTPNVPALINDAMKITWDVITGKTTSKGINLNAEQTETLRTAAEADFKAAEAERVKNQRKLKPGMGLVTYNGTTYGTKEFTEAISKLGKTQRNEAFAIGAIAKAAGFDVEIYEDDSTESARKNQGDYSATGGVRINLAGEYRKGVHRGALATLAHEMTHQLEGNSMTAYANLRTFILNNLQKQGINLQQETQRVIAAYDKENVDLDLNGAIAEIVAKGAEEVLTNEETVKALRAQDPNTYGKMRKIVASLVERIQTALGAAKGTSSIYAQYLRQYSDTMSKLWLSAYEEAKGVTGTAAEETYKALQSDNNEFDGTETHYGDHRQFSLKVTDPDELDFLNNQDTVTTYKTMQLINGKLYPPMAAVVAGNMEDYSELGKWEKATEHPELIKKGNKFTLNKGKGKGSIDAAYNPYMHSSNLMINDQFSGAYDRPNLVTVECKVPVSELDSGYHAEFAKDSVGWNSWHTGTVAGQLRNQKGTERQVMLSRWIMPVRIVPDAEVAQHYAQLLEGTGIKVPDNVVTPSLLQELKKAGVQIQESGRVQKSISDDQNEITDENGNLIPLSQRMVPENKSWKFSMQDAVEERRDGLVAVHNLTEENLINAIRLGGFAMPSIAVIKNDYAHNRYGDISVVFYPSTIDPKATRSNKVYGGDAWTPVYPSVEYKVNKKTLKRVMDRLDAVVPKGIYEGRVELYDDNLGKSLNSNRGDIVKAVGNNLQLMIAYMQDKGQVIDYPTKEKALARSSNYSNEQVLYVLDKIGEEAVKEAYKNDFDGILDNKELIENVRQALNELWKKEIEKKMPESKSKLARLELYSKENFGASKAWNLIEGANNYLVNGINKEYDTNALKDQLEKQIDKEDYEKWLKEQFDGIIEKSGIRNNKNYYTDSGNPRSWEALHDEETLENVVRIMKSELDKGANAFFNQSAMLALGTRDFKSLADIRKHKDQLKHITDEELSRAKTDIVNEFGKLMDEMYDRSERNIFIARDRALGAMVEAVRKSRTPQGIMKELKSWRGLNLTEDMGQRIADLLEEIANLPTEYFEAKPQRAVGFDEIAKVIIPETASKTLTDAMDAQGIPYETYDGTDEDRLRALNAQTQAQFSIQDETDDDVRAWMQSVNVNSLKTEAERELLRNYQGLEMRVQLKQMQIEKWNAEIARLQMNEAQLTADEKKQLQNLRIRVQNATTVKEQAQQELGQIVGSEGYARMMRQQSRVFNDFMYGRTSAEVSEAVNRLQKSAETIAKEIAENQRIIGELEKTDTIKAVKEILESTTADAAAAYLKKKYNSSWKKSELRTYIDPLLLKLSQGQDITNEVQELAEILVTSNAKESYEGLEALRGLTITIGRSAQKELKATDGSLKGIRDQLAGTGIKVRYGESSSLDKDLSSLREEYPGMPEFGNDLDAINEFVSWVNGMRGDIQFYDEKLAEAMADVMSQATAALKNGRLYVPRDTKARKQIMDLVEYVKGLNARTEAAEKTLAKIGDEITNLTKAGSQAAGMADVLTTHIGEALEYYDRTAKLAVAQAKQNRQDALIEQLKSKHAQEILKRNDEWRALIERDKQAARVAEENQRARSQINTALKRMYNLLKNPKGNKNIPEYMQGLAREVLGTFVDNDIAGGRRITRADRTQLEEAKRLLNAWEAQDGPFNLSDINAAEEAVATTINQDLLAIYEGIAAYNGEIKGKNKLDTLQQRQAILKQMQEAVGEIYSAIRAEGEIQLLERRIQVEDQAWKVAQETKGKNAKEWTGKLGGAIRTMHKAIVSGNMTPEYFFRTIGNAGLNDLWEQYHYAENRNGLELAKAKARLAEIADKYGYSGWDTKQKITLELAGGKTEVTLGQLMSLWATWKRENTLGPAMSEHLTKGGFYAETDTREGIIGRQTIERKAHKVTKEDMQAVGGLLTEEQKNFIDEVVGFMSNDMSALGNEASMAAYGIKMYKESYYFPFQMWDGIRSRKSNDAGGAAAAQDRAFHPSFAKTRLHGANNALVIGDFMQTVADHVSGMINYATMGLANENLQKVLNQQTSVEVYGTNRNVRTILEEAYGQEAMQYLAELQKQLNGGAVRTTKSLGDKAISLFRKNAVAGSLSVAFQQPLSYIRAATLISPKYLTKAALTEYWKGSYKELVQHSGVAVIKEMGRFDMNAGQSAREYLMPDGKETGLQKAWGAITEYATILPEKMDAWTWTRMWVAVKAEQHALHPEMDMKSDKFLDMCGTRFNEIMRRTQVYDSTLVKSSNMRSDNYWVKSLTSFMAEPTVTLNVLADAVRSAASGEKGGKGLLAKAGATFLLSAVFQAAIKAVFSSGRSPDDKKTWAENFLNRFGTNLLSEADPVQLIPGYSDLISLLKDGELQDDAMGAIGKLYTSGKGIISTVLGQSDKGVYRDLEDSVGQLTQLMSGLPLKNIMRELRAIYNWTLNDSAYAKRATDPDVLKYQAIEGFWNADNLIGVINKELGDAGYKTDNKTYYQRIYQAQKAGNKAEANSLINFLLTGKDVKEKSLQSGLNTAAKDDEDASGKERVEYLIGSGYTQTKSYIKEQYTAGELTRKEAEALYKKADPKADAKTIAKALDEADHEKKSGKEIDNYSNYTDLREALDKGNGNAVNQAKAYLKKIGYTEDEIANETKSYITTQYKDGKLTNTEANSRLKKYAGMEADDVYWTLDLIDYKKKTGNEKASGKYYRLWDAMDANRSNDISSAVKAMTQHGLKAENIKKQISTQYKQAYLKASSSEKVKIRDAIQKAYKALGYTAEDADKVINKWK